MRRLTLALCLLAACDEAPLSPALRAQQAVAPRVQRDDLVLTRLDRDPDGTEHARYEQRLAGRRVIGGDVAVHTRPNGETYSVHGTPGDLSRAPREPLIGAEDAFALVARGKAPAADLVYLAIDADVRLTWRFAHAGDELFVDASTGGLLSRRALLHSARVREMHDLKGSWDPPGDLVMSEGGSAVSDPIVVSAYENLGKVYDCYSTLFHRDSVDDKGFTLVASMHYGTGMGNAFWSFEKHQFLFGDGDGVQSGPWGNALDMVGHETTHGVIQFGPALKYEGESGALNEGWADIMGNRCEAFANGGPNANTWLLGEDLWTPQTAGDALRYLAEPTKDGQSFDYYPERFQGAWDFGGVHLNSGIAYLAFYLLSNGGRHPRAKTDVTVDAIGFEPAGAIFYRALTYMTSQTDFAGARLATLQAAKDLYGPAEIAAVAQAWTAVGVAGPDAPETVVPLSDGQALVDLALDSGAGRVFTIDVPEHAKTLVVETSNGSGDVSLYARFGSPATTAVHDAKSELPGNDERMEIATPAAGRWFVRLQANEPSAGVRIVASVALSPAQVDLSGLALGTATQTAYAFPAVAVDSGTVLLVTESASRADLEARFGVALPPQVHVLSSGGALHLQAGIVLYRGGVAIDGPFSTQQAVPTPGTATIDGTAVHFSEIFVPADAGDQPFGFVELVVP